MASVNKVIIVGNLGKDPETRTFPNGGQICNIRVATTDRWKDKQSGEMKEITEWHSIVFNDRLAEVAPRLSLERLCERIVADHDYDLAVLAQWDGRRRYANLRKLARLARSYEELRGRGVDCQGVDEQPWGRFVTFEDADGNRWALQQMVRPT